MLNLAGIILIIIFSIYLISRYGQLVSEIKEYRFIKLKKMYPKLSEHELAKKYGKNNKNVFGADRIIFIIGLIGVFLLLMS